ncbi:hypothetical protein ACFXKY_15640 [Streptomyces canus]
MEQARSEADQAPEVHADTLARYVTTVGQGVAVQAVGGTSREDLHRVVD